MTIFYFVRHGETRINQEQRFNGGNVDSPLTEKGVAGAKITGRLLREVHFDAAFASSMPRAVKTARIILKQNFYNYPEQLQTDPRLREIDLGDWDGQKIQAMADHPQFSNYFNRPDLFDAAAVHAEPFAHLLKRSTAAITDYIQSGAQTVLVVSHGSLLLVLLNQLTGGDLAQVRKRKMLANSSVTLVRAKTQPPFEMIGFNVTADSLAGQPALKPYFGA